jgi:hypothetical protein
VRLRKPPQGGLGCCCCCSSHGQPLLAPAPLWTQRAAGGSAAGADAPAGGREGIPLEGEGGSPASHQVSVGVLRVAGRAADGAHQLQGGGGRGRAARVSGAARGRRMAAGRVHQCAGSRSAGPQGRCGVPRSLRLVGSGHPTPLHTTGLCCGSPCLVPQVPDVHCSGASGAGHCQRLAIPFGVLDRARRPFEALSILGRCIKSVLAIRGPVARNTRLYSGCTFFAAERSGARSAARCSVCALLHV